MKRIVVVLGVAAVMAAVVALTAGTALAQAQRDTQTIENLYIENPCTGEYIVWNGTVDTVWHEINNANGRHYSYHSRLNIFGTGLETGDTYRMLNAGNDIGNEVIIEGEYYPSESHYVNVGLHTLVVSDGASPNFLINVVFRYTGSDEPQPGDISFYNERCTPDLETAPTT